MPPSIADASKGDLSPTDLLIRSITTILWLLWPKAKNSQSHSKHHLQRLSRLSLLFVSATQAADVAAITAIVDRSCVHVEAIQGQEEAPDGRLEVVKNHLEFALWNAAKLPGPETLKAELWEIFLLNMNQLIMGIAAITPDAHGAALQKLLTDMYELAPTCPETQSSRDPLRFYVYCFCHKKILHRLQYGILGYSGRFLELFLGSKKQSAVTAEDFQRRSKLAPESPEHIHVDEAWLYHQLVEKYQGEDFGPEPTDGQSYRLLLDESQLWKLWDYFTSCLDDLQYSLEWLGENTRGNQPESYSKAIELLEDAIAPLMRTLYDFQPRHAFNLPAHTTQIQNVAIGVSKRCCYCCAILLSKLGFRKDDISNHGKVYSWPPPPEMDSDVKEHILKKLKRRLEQDLEKYSEGRREPDSSSGSEMGSSVTRGHRKAPRSVRRDYFSKHGK
ncbi:hypothetical protein FS837_004876 [Tulasnella sp. UAMH 9824]|nr:hypothetical protein FS837_004876 [Tulasnella sp. UAMH 9824]